MAKWMEFLCGLRFYQYLATLGVCFSTTAVVSHYGWTSPSLVILESTSSEMQVTSDEGSWLTVSLMFGTTLGAIINAVFMRKIGRKPVLLMATVPLVVSWFMLAYGKSLVVLALGRFIAGISDTIVFSTGSIYIAEISESKIRGALMTFLYCTGSFGYILMNNLVTYLSIRDAALISVCFPTISFFIILMLPESPYYLIHSGKESESKRCLKLFRGRGDIDDDFNQIRKAFEDETQEGGRFYHLFTVPRNRKAMAIVLGVRTINQMSGSTALSFYMQSIFGNLQSGISASGWSTIYFSVQLSFTIVTSFLIDRIGRKPLFIFSISGVSLTLTTLSVIFYLNATKEINENLFAIISSTTLIFYVTFFNLGLQMAPSVLTAELFPTNVKFYAAGVHELYYSTTSIVASKIYYITESNFGIWVPFMIYAIASILGVVFVTVYVPETKGKTLEEILKIIKPSDSNDGDELQPIK